MKTEERIDRYIGENGVDIFGPGAWIGKKKTGGKSSEGLENLDHYAVKARTHMYHALSALKEAEYNIHMKEKSWIMKRLKVATSEIKNATMFMGKSGK